MKTSDPAVKLSPRGRVCTLNILALKRELDAGTLTDRDREIAEKILPGCCDLFTGKVKSIKV